METYVRLKTPSCSASSILSMLFSIFFSLLARLDFLQTLAKVNYHLRSRVMNLKDHILKCISIS